MGMKLLHNLGMETVELWEGTGVFLEKTMLQVLDLIPEPVEVLSLPFVHRKQTIVLDLHH